MKSIRIGTRASNLALKQANMVKQALEEKGYPCQIVEITTRGDKDQRDFHHLLGDGFFTRNIEKALLDKEVDIAIHSAKDLPSLRHDGLPWAAFGKREDYQDVIIKKRGIEIHTIGTSSPRRHKQIQKAYPKANVLAIRGNVETRLEKLRGGEYDATLLALAGLKRLGLLEAIQKEFNVSQLKHTTAPTQGIIAIQVRKKDYDILECIENKKLSQIAFQEKEVLRFLGGGCQLAVGANADDGSFHFFRDNKEYSFENKKEYYLQNVVDSMIGSDLDKKVLLTHSIQQQEKVAKLFYNNKIGVCSYPLIETKTIFSSSDWDRDFSEYDFIFTSPNAVKIFFQEAFARNLDLNIFKEKKIYCVGEATARQVDYFGFPHEVVPKQASSKDLIPRIKSPKPLFIGNPNGVFAKASSFEVMPIYDSFAYEDLWPLPKEKIEHYIFCSPSSVEIAVNKFGKNQLSQKKLYAFGPTTGKALHNLGFSYIENTKSGSWPEMVEVVKKNL